MNRTNGVAVIRRMRDVGRRSWAGDLGPAILRTASSIAAVAASSRL
jgi:hypothetical protein